MKWAILIGLLFHCCLAVTQEPADINVEPHYRLLLENNQVRAYSLRSIPMNRLWYACAGVS